MRMESGHWLDRAACRKHLLLSSEAWFELKGGRPSGDGIKALMVCRFACPVRQQCSELSMGANAIFGGGWTDRLGRFINPGDGTFVDLAQGAVFLGTTQHRLAQHLKRHNAQPAMAMGNRNLYSFDTVSELAPVLAPTHGTLAASELHILRGQPQCQLCIKAPR